jgi:predicted TPR repeat methyltransferase
MFLKNKLRAVYSRTVHGNVIVLIDHDQGKSLTNDAENVIADLATDFDLSKYLIIHRDTRGIYDQLLVDSTGHFAGFSSINERDLSAALAKLTRH